MSVGPVTLAATGDEATRRSVPASIRIGRFIAVLALLDIASATAAGGLAAGLRFGDDPGSAVLGVPYGLVALLLPGVWLLALSLASAYDRRILASGAEEFRRVINTAVWLTAAVAFTSFALHANISRAFVGIDVPSSLVLTLLGRYGARKVLHRRLAGGAALHRVVVVGTVGEVAALTAHMRRAPYAGFAVVGRIVSSRPSPPGADAALDLPVAALPATVAALGADTIAVAGNGALGPGGLRQLSWALENTGIQLVVAPAVTDIAGPRIVVRPVDGLPLLHVEEPELQGARRLVKNGVERCAAAVLLAALSPLLIGLAVAVRLDTPGPAIFRQRRIGIGGREFTLLKFRTMTGDAEELRGDVEHLNDRDAVLFKARRDPRVTRVGRSLRRHSLDELPQLWNVVRGQMSLVGPRPPLAAEVARFGPDAHRRFLVKPGMTGLWQVSGRADLDWDETVRLDLYYVENWSVALDILVLWKTLAAVIHGRGAY